MYIRDMSYVGRGVREGSALPPAVRVDGLLDSVATACASTAGDPAALAEVASGRAKLEDGAVVRGGK